MQNRVQNADDKTLQIHNTSENQQEDRLATNFAAETVHTLMGQEEEYIRMLKIRKNLAVNGSFNVHGKLVQYSKKSMFMFDEKNALRRFSVWLIEWKWFDRFILLCILVNSIILGLYDYSDRDALTEFNQSLNWIGTLFTIVFIVEAGVKIFAMGFILHKYSYLRDGWNLIDFIIVITGVADLVAASVNLKSLRILRVLRPLKSINAIPSMRMLVTTLLQSLPELFNATIFLSFIIILFGILGLQSFNGIIYNKCRLTEKPINSTYWPKSSFHSRVCSPGGDGAFTCPDHLYCGNPLTYGISLQDDGVYDDEQIQYGISSFDNFGQSILGVFQVITKDNWTNLMYNLVDGYTSAFSKIYFSCIIVLGSYFMLNLILAVIMQNFTRICQLELETEVSKTEKELHIKPMNTSLELPNGEISSRSQQASGRNISNSSKNGHRPGKSTFHKGGKNSDRNLLSHRSQSLAQPQLSSMRIIKEEEESQIDEQNFENEEKKETPKEVLSPFKQLMLLKKQKDAEKQKEADSIEKLTKNAGKDENGHTIQRQLSQQSGKNLAKGFALALFAKAMQLDTKEQQELDQVKDRIARSQTEADIQTRLKTQHKIYDDQKKMLQKMDYEIKKKYALSRRNVYGIDNESQIITQIKKRLTELLAEKEKKAIAEANKNENDSGDTDDDEIEHELDEESEIALKIASNLKEQTMKQHIKELLFNKFKSQLIRRNMLEKIFLKLEKQMIDNTLSLRSKGFCFFRVSLFIVRSYIFNLFMVFCIVGNAIVLALDSYPGDSERSFFIEAFNLAFFTAFVVELILKLSAFGFKYYFRDKFNWFDSLVVTFSVFDVVLYYANVNNSAGSGAISALRVFRLIRIFQLAKVWKEFQDLLLVISQTLKDISNISILLLLMIFTYSLLGMELFAFRASFNDENKLDLENGKYPQSNFNTFYDAFLSVFIVLANDGWTKIYFTHWRATDSVVSTFFFITLLIVGQYILLNLFIAILIENFEQVSVHQDTVNKHNKMAGKGSIRKFIRKVICFNSKHKVEPVSEDEEEKIKDIKAKKDQEAKLEPSLYIFSLKNKIRKKSINIINHKRFEILMFLAIIANCVQLAVDNPLNDPRTGIATTLNVVDIFLTCLFTIEAILKIIGLGFAFCGSTSYIRNGWNGLDFFVVCLSIVSLSITKVDLSSIKVLRLLKVLRPLRMVARNEGLKISLLSLALAIPGIVNIIIVSLICYFIFGIIGMNYIKGRLYHCEYDHLMKSMFNTSQIDDKWDCISFGGVWSNYHQNFDNIGAAMQTLYQISTTVMWQDLMYMTQGVRGLDLDLQGRQNIGLTIFFVAFIVVGNFFLLNLFVGVVITTYNREKELLGKNFLLTEKQRKWLHNKIMLIHAKPMMKMKLPIEEWRHPFFYLAELYWFDRFILMCILTNTVVLAIKWIDQPPIIDFITDTINYVFAAIFTMEVIIKLIAYGSRYFKDGWNNFDVIIVLMTLISIGLSLTTNYQLGPNTTIIRSFRIGRVFKLFRWNKSLKIIFQTFLLTLPAMANIGSLLLLFIFIYSVLGVYLFADIRLSGSLHANCNFQGVGNAFLTLIRISTGEDWPALMRDLSKSYSERNQCIETPTFYDYEANDCNHFLFLMFLDNTIGCGDYYFALIYFYSYVLLINLIYLKLFIAIILQGFQDTTEKDNKILNSETSDRFRDTWSRFDPDATTFMRETNYGNFLLALGEPMGWDQSFEFNYLKQQEYLNQVALPKYNNKRDYQFMDVFEHLALLMIIKKEVNEYIKRYQQKMANIQKIKKMMSIRSDPNHSIMMIQNQSLNQTPQSLRIIAEQKSLIKSPVRTNRTSPGQKSKQQSLNQSKQSNEQVLGAIKSTGRQPHREVVKIHQTTKDLNADFQPIGINFDNSSMMYQKTQPVMRQSKREDEDDDFEKKLDQLLNNNSIMSSESPDTDRL